MNNSFAIEMFVSMRVAHRSALSKPFQLPTRFNASASAVRRTSDNASRARQAPERGNPVRGAHIVGHAEDGGERDGGRKIDRALETGTMPCNGAWPAEKLETFRRWVESGTPA
jgi:hypothetical protein